MQLPKPILVFCLVTIGLWCFHANAQNKMTLDACIKYALANNISIQQSSLNIEQNSYKLMKDKAAMLPSANAYASHSYSFGNSLDYTTYEYVKESTLANYFSLSSDLTLFNGMRIQNTIKADKSDLLSSKYAHQDVMDQISLTLASVYLQIIMNIENVKFANDQVELTKKLLERAKLLVEVGQETKSKELELKAQLANDEVSLVEAENNLQQSYLSLKQIMNYDISQPLEIVTIDLDPENYFSYLTDQVDNFINESVDKLPGVKKAASDLEQARYALKATKALIYPSLGVSGSMSSRYSSAIAALSFNDQVENNFGQTLSFGVNVPIFNNLQNSYSINLSKIAIKNAELNLNDIRTVAKNDIYEAYYMMSNAQKKYIAAKNSYEAQTLFFEQSNIKYNEGVINFYDWQSSKNSLSKSQTAFLSAKYDYLYRIKIFEYYKGIPISL